MNGYSGGISVNVEIDSLYQGMMDRLSDLRRERRGYEEVLCFYAEVLAAQRAAQQDMVVAEPDLPEENTRLRVREGFPLIARESFPVDIKGAELLFGKLCRVSRKGNPLLASAGKALQDAVDRQEFNFAQLISATLTEKSEDIKILADGAGVSPTILCALGRWSMQPSLFALSLAVAGEPLLDDWQRGHCPICGAFPAMAALVGKEGKRWALCSFCGHVWRLNRVGCPFCGTENHKGLRYFYAEGEEVYRVYVCDHCTAYLKVMDTRKQGNLQALPVDDVATAHLDLLAEGEGYVRKAPGVMPMKIDSTGFCAKSKAKT